MLFRIDSEPFEIEEEVYEFISRENSETYEPAIGNDPEKTSTANQTKTFTDGPEGISIGPGGIFLHIGVLEALVTPPISPPMSPGDGILSPSADTVSFGLPKNWVILPLVKEEPLERKSSIRVTLSKEEVPLNKRDSFSGQIDIDWDDPINPVKFNTGPNHQSDGYTEGQFGEHDQNKPQPIELQPICFSIVEDEIDPSSYFGTHNGDSCMNIKPENPLYTVKRQPELLNDNQLRNARREARHHIRVVTRNSIGLATSIALSTVAPQLLIAAAINAYCLTQGTRHLYHHSRYLRQHGISIRKRDVAVAVAEGVTVKLALLLLTVGHDDFLVFSNTWFSAAIKPISHLHDFMFGHSAIGDPAAWFVKPAEVVQTQLGIATAEERVAGAMTGGWGEPVRQLMENIFVVGAVQAGMELGLERVEQHVGYAHDKIRAEADKVRDWIWHPKQRGVKTKEEVQDRPSLKGRRSWSDSDVQSLKKKQS